MNLTPQPSDKSRQELWPLAREITDQLNETDNSAREQVVRILLICGEAFTQAVLEETLRIEAEGGMMTMQGDRRRTPGGVFFYLVQQYVPIGLRGQLRGLPQYKVTASERRRPLFDWGQRVRLLHGVLKYSGEADEVIVKLTGRPGKVHRYQNLVVLSMQDGPHPEAKLPIGLPEMPAEPVTYVVYVVARQWDRVEKTLKNPEVQLVINGYCAHDPETGGMAVFAIEVTRRKARRKKPTDTPAEVASEADVPTPVEVEASPPVAEKPTPAARKPDAKPKRKSDRPLPEMPPVELSASEAEQKLAELRAAAASFQEKLDALEQLPENERYGAEFTRRLLDNTLRQIEALEGQGE